MRKLREELKVAEREKEGQEVADKAAAALAQEARKSMSDERRRKGEGPSSTPRARRMYKSKETSGRKKDALEDVCSGTVSEEDKPKSKEQRDGSSAV